MIRLARARSDAPAARGVALLTVMLVACARDSAAAPERDEAGKGSTATDGSTGVDPSTRDSVDATSSDATSSSTSDGADASTSTGAQACAEATLGPGMHLDLQIEHGGLVRTYDVFVPPSADGPLPLVVDMHGWGSTKEREAMFSQLAAAAERRGYAVAYPAGVGDSWNAGFCCGDAVSDEVDDVGFLVAMVEQLADDACIDRARVYAAGFSNGGFMAYRLACAAAATFAAIAPVAGVMGLDAELCAPALPVSVLHFHGTDDFNVAYDGRPWLGVPGPRDAMAHWAEHNDCATDPVVTFEQDDVVCETWPGCTNGAEVSLCSIEGGGHCWPGNAECAYGASSTTISASERMLAMFDMHAR